METSNNEKEEKDMQNSSVHQQLIDMEKEQEMHVEEMHVVSPLGRVNDTKLQRMHEENIKASESLGYRPFNLKALPSEGLFYPQDAVLKFRACNTDEIKFYSSMPEQENPIEIASKIEYILERTCKLTWGGQNQSIDNLKDTDKICMFFAVRDLTMEANGKENKIMNTAKCSSCGKEHKYEITNDIFTYFKFDQEIKDFYDDRERCFVFTDSELPESVRMYIPSMGIMSRIMKYIYDKETGKMRGTESGYYNPRHLEMLSFVVKDAIELTPERLNNCSREIEMWNSSKFELVNYLVDKLKIAIKPTVSIKCDKKDGGCGAEVITQIMFPDGWRHLLNISNIIGKLFSNSKQSMGS